MSSSKRWRKSDKTGRRRRRRRKGDERKGVEGSGRRRVLWSIRIEGSSVLAPSKAMRMARRTVDLLKRRTLRVTGRVRVELHPACMVQRWTILWVDQGVVGRSH